MDGGNSIGTPIEAAAEMLWPDAGDAVESIGPTGQPRYVVGLGASAGGLEALEQFFDKMPAKTGLAYVVIQHLSPDFRSLMDELSRGGRPSPSAASKTVWPWNRTPSILSRPRRR